MLRFSHIPVGDKKPKDNLSYDTTDRLSDIVENIIRDGLNGSLTFDESRRYGLFFSKAVEVLGIQDEGDGVDHVSLFNLMEHFPTLANLYLSLCVNNEADSFDLVQDQWENVSEYGDTLVSIGTKHFYEVYQNVHGDVSVRQYPFIEKIQGDLFGKEWLSVSNMSGDQISSYQETMGLVSAMLKSYMLAGGANSELDKVLLELNSKSIRGVHAADSGTDDLSIVLGLNSISREQTHPKYLGIYVHSNYNSGYQSAFNNNSKELEFWDIRRTDEGQIIERKVMSIPSEDIPGLLKSLCILSGRSGHGPRILISEFTKRKNS